MIERALGAGMPVAWLTADEAYGQDKRLRVWLEQRGLPYVLCTRSTDTVSTRDWRTRQVRTLAAAVPAAAWERRSAGAGAHGPRIYDWALVALLPGPTGGWARWLLVRRSITDPTELAYYICAGPAHTTVTEVITVAGSRWAIEECFQAAKGEAGLDHYQVRDYTTWYRHINLAMLAHAYLSALRAREADRNPAGPPDANTTATRT
jgi:SRSO17 transposase